MPAKCNLIVDSCCDLPYDVVNRDGVTLLAFPYTLSDGEHTDDMFHTLDPHDFYEGIRKGERPTTCQLSMSALVDVFTQAAKQGTPTVYLSFTSGLSGSFDVATMALQQVQADNPDCEIHIVDTKLASIAEGILVYEAIRQRDNGLSAQELAQWATEARNFIQAAFMVEDLDSLSRGGRLPSVGAYLGSKLDVKPMVGFDLEGHLSMSGVVRGRKKGIRQLADFYAKGHPDDGGKRTVIIGHSDCGKDAQKLEDMVMKSDPDALVMHCNIGPVIGSHVGPGMLAIVFWGADRRESLSVADRIARRIKGQDK